MHVREILFLVMYLLPTLSIDLKSFKVSCYKNNELAERGIVDV